jgi:organic hydroperoxide reductase OsmC/OhrA
MARYTATVDWRLGEGEDFLKGRYSRGHTLAFDGGVTAPGSASAHVVGNRWSVEAAVDPEEMLVAALSACHMLTFLHKARLAGYCVLAYRDDAEGLMESIGVGRMAVTRVTLRPTITYAGAAPDQAERDALHHAAHEECFIANSVTTEVTVVDVA